MSLAELVEKVGRMNVYWQKHRLEWTDQEWLQRRKKLLELTEQMDFLLDDQERELDQFGWRICFDGQWARLGEPDPPPRLTDEEKKSLLAYSKAAAQEEEQPELELVASDQAGFSPW